MALLRTRQIAVRLALAMLVSAALCAVTHGQTINEYELKAAFLYNFAKFVEWPPEAFKGPSEPIAICILGENPFGGALEQAVNGKLVDGRKFVIRQVTGPQQASRCHILFVCSPEQKRALSILGELKTAGSLTVGDTDGFASAGGVVNFMVERGKIRFQINLEAAEREKLRISSKLLNLAQIVKR
jgi:YfiR/HmsC-like